MANTKASQSQAVKYVFAACAYLFALAPRKHVCYGEDISMFSKGFDPTEKSSCPFEGIEMM